MKTKHIFLAAIAIAFCGCAQFAPESALKTIPLTLSAVSEDEDLATKTYSNTSNQILWSGSNEISVFDSKGVNNRFTIVSSGKAVAEFTGLISADSEPTYAVYPYNDGITMSGSVASSVPAISGGKFTASNENSLVNGMNIAIGQVVDEAVRFKSATGFFKASFKMNASGGKSGKETDIRKVEFFAEEINTSDKTFSPLVAILDVDYNEGNPIVTPSTDETKAKEAKPTITVSPKKDKTTSEYLKSYVLANVIPGTYNGISAVATDKDGNIKAYHKSAAVTVVRNRYLDFGEFSVDPGTVTVDIDLETNQFGVTEFKGNPTWDDTYKVTEKVCTVAGNDWTLNGQYSYNTSNKGLQCNVNAWIKIPKKSGYKPVYVVCRVNNTVANYKTMSICTAADFSTVAEGGASTIAIVNKPAVFILKGTSSSNDYYFKLASKNTIIQQITVAYLPES